MKAMTAIMSRMRKSQDRGGTVANVEKLEVHTLEIKANKIGG